MGFEPLITSVAAAIFLREHIGPRRWIGFCLGLSGVVFMAQVWRPDFKLPGLTANALIVASFIAETAYSVMGKPLIARASFLKVLAIALLAGTIVNAGIDGSHTFAAVRVMPLRVWLLVIYLAVVCTLAGYVLWFVVIRETEVNVTALTVFLQPVVGVIIACVWLGESVHWGQLWGSVAIIAGLVIALSRQVKRNNASAAQSG
jgi:drug/metabolite transporter (DMT)-like permease